MLTDLYRLYRIATIFSLLSICSFVSANSENTGFIIYTLKDGLSQASVNDIVEDSHGYLWLGTQGGLNRFDGSGFEVFKHSNTDSTSVCGDFILCLFNDKEGNIWIGTDKNGACYYSYETNSFHRIHFPKKNTSVYSISQDSLGNIFAALGENGLAVLLKNERQELFPEMILHDYCTSVASSNGTFIGTQKGIIYKLNYKTKNSWSVDTLFTAPDSSAVNILKLHDRSLWIGTRLNGYRLILPDSKKVLSDYKRFFSEPTIVYDFDWNNVNEMFISTGNGLYQFYFGNSGFYSYKHFTFNNNNPNSLSNNTVYSLYQGSNNMLWIGTGKYLNLLYTNPYLNKIESDPYNKPSLKSNVVFSIYENSSGLWVGTSGGGLNRIKDNKVDFFSTNNSNLSSEVVFSIAGDTSGNLWIGTKEGLSVLPVGSISSNQIKFINLSRNNMMDNFVRQVYCDKTGQIWVCTYNGGLYRFTGNLQNNDFSFQSFRTSDSLLSNRVYCIFQDKVLNYWVGTSNGLNTITKESNIYRVKNFLKKNDIALSNNVIYDIIEDNNGILWVGTRNGLNRVNPKTGKSNQFTTENGLPDNIIYSILTDNDNNLWFSTNKGIAVRNKKNGEFKTYTVLDGLQGNEFNLHAKYYDTVNNQLYFGGLNGINYFIPDSLYNIDKETPLILSNIRFGNGKTVSVFKRNADSAINIKLEHNDFPFYLNFSQIDLRPYKSVQYAYRLIPSYKKWSYLGQNHEIQFPDLKHGNYRIEIQGLSRGKLWKSKPLIISITVHPPWWFSWWMWVFYAAGFICLVYVLYSYRLKQAITKKEAKRLQELDALKNQLYIDITHEFRTPLSIILGTAAELKENTNYDEKETLSRFESIENNSNNLLNLVNQMMDLSMIDNSRLKLSYTQSDIIPYLRYVFSCYQHLATSKEIKYTFYSEIEQLVMNYDSGNLYKVIANLLSNAIKYTPDSGEVVMHVKFIVEDNKLVIKVTDTGIGIPASRAHLIFDRFYRIENKEYPTQGTGIGLALTKKLITLMNGEINYTPMQKGSVFTVSLPVENTAHMTISGKPKIVVPGQSAPAGNHQINNNSENTVLIIDDNPDIIRLLTDSLSKNYNVLIAYNGTDGFELAVKEVPDIVISDIMMPGINGYELCNNLKQNEVTNHIPVLLLTARADKSDKLKGYLSNADDYLTKPFEKHELLIRIKSLLNNRQIIIEKFAQTSQSPTGNKEKDEFIKRINDIVGKNLSDPNFKTSDLAFEAGMSESQLYRKLKAVTGFSTAIFIREYRLHRAKEKIISENRNISEIAYDCGFNDPAWFSRAFKEKFGVSPTQIRKS